MLKLDVSEILMWMTMIQAKQLMIKDTKSAMIQHFPGSIQ